MQAGGEDDVLVVVDVQRDFCSGGALAVADGDAVVAPVNRLMDHFRHVILTQDWHPADHSSFAAQHPGRQPFDVIRMPYGEQRLWPVHCVIGTPGAEFHPQLDPTRAELVLRKGFRREIDSYSAFIENDHATETGLAGYLRERGLRRVFVAGLALDYCVGFSALDARRLGFEAWLISDATRAVDPGESMTRMQQHLATGGVACLTSDALLA